MGTVMINNIVLKVAMNFVFKLVALIGARCGFKCSVELHCALLMIRNCNATRN